MATKAKESSHIRKARRKLKHQLTEEHKRINKKALEQMSISIKRWISRHAGERISLLSKTFTLFDENQHPASPQDKFIHQLAQQLTQETAAAAPVSEEASPNILEGRVTF